MRVAAPCDEPGRGPGFFRAGSGAKGRRAGRAGGAANEKTYEGERSRGDGIAWRDRWREFVV